MNEEKTNPMGILDDAGEGHGFEGMEAEVDLRLEELLRGGYDAMDPGPEAEARMKRALLEAQAAWEAGEGQGGEGQEAAEQAVAGQAAAEQAVPAAKRPVRRVGTWLPIAACLLVVAVGVGVAVNLGNGNNLASQAKTDGAEAAMEAAPEAVETEEAAAGAANSYDLADAQALQADSGMAMVATEESAEALTADGYYSDIAWNTEEYSALDETGFVSTAVNPLSTVSADVDTASYCNLRRLIRSGQVPTGAVRIEEMLNYFTYDYATPTARDRAAGNDFSITTQIAPCPWNQDTQLLTLGFATARETGQREQGANLVFLIDVSGSMDSSDKLELLQDAFAVLTDQLNANDVVSVVTYASGEEVVLDGARGADARQIQRAIDKLRADGATNGQAGLQMAYELAEKHYIDGGVNRIILASDGDLNVGMSSESDLHDFVAAKRESGIYLSVLGFGAGNYKDNKMETLADNGNGQYHYIDCIEEAQRVFGQDLLANLVPFADDVKVQVEFNPAQVKAYRLIGYENRTLAAEDFLDDTVDAGDVGPNSQFTVAVPDLKYGADSAATGAGTGAATGATASATAGATAGADELLTCSLRYCAFADGQVHEQQAVVEKGAITQDPGSDWSLAAAVIEFGMLLRSSDYAGTATLDTVLDLLEAVPYTDEGHGFYELVQQVRGGGVDVVEDEDPWYY